MILRRCRTVCTGPGARLDQLGPEPVRRSSGDRPIALGVVSPVVAAFAFATALSGSVTGIVLALVLFGAPALCVLILGLLALRLVPARSGDAAMQREAQRQ